MTVATSRPPDRGRHELGRIILRNSLFATGGSGILRLLNFGFTIGWKLPAGTANLARLVEQLGERPSAAVWRDSE